MGEHDATEVEPREDIERSVQVRVSSSSSDTVSTHIWVLYTGLFLESCLSQRVVKATTCYTFTPCVGSFTSPGIGTSQKGPTALGTPTKRRKRNCQSSEAKFRQQDSNLGSPGHQSNALTQSATAPP